MARLETRYARRAMQTRLSKRNGSGKYVNCRTEKRTIQVDMVLFAVHQQYLDMTRAVMARIEAEALDKECDPLELSQLMLSYAALIRAVNGGNS